MPLTITNALACFEECCTVEEALPLLEFLKSEPAAEIDLSRCTYLHSALLQLLFMADTRIVAGPDDPILARWIGRVLSIPQNPAAQ